MRNFQWARQGRMGLLLLCATSTAFPAWAAGKKKLSEANYEPSADLSSIAPAFTLEESLQTHPARKQALLAHLASAEMPAWDFKDPAVSFISRAAARLELGMDVAEVNRRIMEPVVDVYGEVGSDFQRMRICRRVGDYDFALKVWIPLIYRFWNRPDVLYPETRDKILHRMLTARGNQVRTKVKFRGCGKRPETENHILMTESSRYLTNQLLAREALERGQELSPELDNRINGMTEWMLKHLQQFLKRDFSEFNSRPYQAHAVMPILNLIEYSEDERVRTAATLVLDYLSAKFAVSSQALKHSAPFRRQSQHRYRTDLLVIDKEAHRMMVQAGNTQSMSQLKAPYRMPGGVDSYLVMALGEYAPPAPILKLLVGNVEKGAGFHRFKHAGVEIYDHHKQYVISAGGVWINYRDFGTGENNAWAVPTTLVTKGGGIDGATMLRFMGDVKEKNRVNTCVAPGFMCGVNFELPADIPWTCLQTKDHWIFFNGEHPDCAREYGFYAAIYNRQCYGKECGKGNADFGFVEVADAEQAGFFETFKRKVLENNADAEYRPQGLQSYVTSHGKRIEFRFIPEGTWQWPIESIDGEAQVTDMNRWPLVQGESFRQVAPAVLRFDGEGAGLTLDYSNPLQPVRLHSLR